MRIASIPLETDVNFRPPRIQTRTSLEIIALLAASLLAQGVVAAPGEIEKGATRLLNPPPRVSAYASLPSEETIPEFQGLVCAFKSFPQTNVFLITTREGHPVRLAVQRVGTGNRDRVVVMIHGVLANHEAWRYVAGELGNDFDLWLVDLPGSGQSEKPDPKSLEPDGYSPTAMADRVWQALEQCVATRAQAPRLTIVAHSLGGMTAIRMMSDPDLRQRHAVTLKLVEGMVLLAPCDVAVHQEIPKYRQIIQLRGYEVAIGDALGIVENAAAKADLNGFCARESVTRETTSRLIRCFTDADQRRAYQAMLAQAVPWKVKEHRPDWNGIRKLEEHYRNIDIPCEIVWGQQDETLPVSMGYKLQAQIPGAKLTVLPDCMHSIQLEHPIGCAKIIREHVAVQTAAASNEAVAAK